MGAASDLMAFYGHIFPQKVNLKVLQLSSQILYKHMFHDNNNALLLRSLFSTLTSLRHVRFESAARFLMPYPIGIYIDR